MDLAECAYKDNSDGTVSDTDNDLQWSIRDSRQELGKWLNWDEAEAYVKACNEQSYLAIMTGDFLPRAKFDLFSKIKKYIKEYF